MTCADIAGWIGMILVLIAYALISFKKLSSQSSAYHLMNLVGVSCIGVNVFVQKAWPVFVLECIWGLVATVTLIKIRIDRGDKK